MEIILHTTDCPKCKVLEKKLQQAGIEYRADHNIQAMIDQGYMQAPLLQIDYDVFLPFGLAVDWINAKKGLGE